MPPRFSPAPGWEALKGTTTPNNETSGDEDEDEDELIEDTESIGVRPTPQLQASLKRKETEHLGTASKRPRHEQERRQDEGTSRNASSISGSAFSAWKMPRDMNNIASSSSSSQTLPTKANKSIPTGSRVASSSSSSMRPPPSPVKTGTNDQIAKRPLPLPERPKPTPKFKSSSQSVASTSKLTSSQAPGGTKVATFQRKEFPSTLSPNLFGRKPPSQAGPSSTQRSVSSNKPSSSTSQGDRRKTWSANNEEIIDLCSDDSPPPPQLKSKPRSSLPTALPTEKVPVIDMSDEEEARPAPRKLLARKSVGGRPPRRHPPKPTNQLPDPDEIIDISSDSDDPPPSSKPTSKSTITKTAGKSSNLSVSRPATSAKAKDKKKVAGSKSASESDSMKVDPIVAAKPQSSASTTALASRKVSITGLTESMQLDDLPIKPQSSATATVTGTAPLPRKISIAGLTESMQLDDQPIAGPSTSTLPLPSRQAVSAKPPTVTGTRLPSQIMQVEKESMKPVPSVIQNKPKPDLIRPQSSNSKPSPAVPPPKPSTTTATAAVPTPSVGSSRSGFIPKSNQSALPLTATTTATVPKPSIGSSSSAFIPKSKHVSTSSESTTTTTTTTTTSRFSRPQVAMKSTGGGIRRRQQVVSSSSSSSSSNGSDSDDEQEEEEEEEEEEVSLNLVPAIAEEEEEEKAREEEQEESSPPPEPKSAVDKRPLDQALGLEAPPSVLRTKTPERTIRVKQQPISPELFSNRKVRTPQKPSISSSSGLDLKTRGDTIESAIDLTSDNEDATTDSPLSAAKSPQQKPVSTLSKWKGKGRALAESPTPPPHSEPEEHLPRPSDSEPSLPPPSPSPIKTPLSPNRGFPTASSAITIVEAGRKSAPLVLSQDTTANPFDLVGLTGPLSTSPKTSPSKGHVRSISLGSQAQSSFDVPPVNDTAIRSDARVIPPVPGSSKAQEAPAPTNAISPPPTSKSPGYYAQPNPPLSTSVHPISTRPTSVASESSPNVVSQPDSSDDIEMQDSELDYDDTSEAEEVRTKVKGLVDTIDHFRQRLHALDNSDLDGSREAGPSNRSPSSEGRLSRRSSRSSTSDVERVPSDDEPLQQESEFPSRNTTPEEGPVSVPKRGKTLGGFPAITWKEYRQDLANFAPKCYHSRNLPHSLQDHINNMSERTRKMPELRKVFEAMIQENTFENEPNAPPIELVNEIDDEPTPPWEFHYTNEMWHGEGVPPPDIKNLTSCNCKGVCNPRSKTCACLKRQREAVGDRNAEFMYDKYGRLRQLAGWPVNECNDLCGCGDECRNRVVQHGRKVQILIKKTEHKGWGVFAGTKKIPKGTFIGIYSGELLTDAEAGQRGINYNKFGRTYLFDLDFHHLRVGTDDPEGWASKFTVDAYHAGNFTRFLNHSCDPNCVIQPVYINEGNLEKPLLVIFSDRDIEAHEEICFSYSGDVDEPGEEGEEEPGEGSSSQIDKIYAPCMCGAYNCTGSMFKRASNQE